jgi:hypothetical protein
MKPITINITQAKIMSYDVKLRDDKPEISCTIALMSDSGKSIATYSVGTESWRDQSTQFALSPGIVDSILSMSHHLEGVVTAHCENQQKLLANVVEV